MWSYFTDPVLRAPTIGCMLMCLSAALVGVIVFLRKQSLLGESLSHAAYPGVIIGVILAGLAGVLETQELALSAMILGGAFLTAIAGLWTIRWLEQALRIRSDSALCFVLASFFGIGLTLASHVQFAFSSLYRQVQAYLYGQAATMTDSSIAVYGVLALAVIAVIALFHKEIQAIAFDIDYARSLGINTKAVDAAVFFLIVFAVVIGIRSVGVVLMSAMLIAPAAAARQFTNKLHRMFLLAAFFGLICGYLGNYLSVAFSNEISSNTRLTLPTGPMIVIVASFICFLALMFAPKRGVVLRLVRIAAFRYRCMGENLLKVIWRVGPNQTVPFEEIERYQSASPWYLRFVLWRLAKQRWIVKSDRGYKLTTDGALWAARIVRLHRLWELYLVDDLGLGAERVHRSAEEMEHIITPELEAELTLMLNDPKYDPHHQPIPSAEA